MSARHQRRPRGSSPVKTGATSSLAQIDQPSPATTGVRGPVAPTAESGGLKTMPTVWVRIPPGARNCRDLDSGYQRRMYVHRGRESGDRLRARACSDEDLTGSSVSRCGGPAHGTVRERLPSRSATRYLLCLRRQPLVPQPEHVRLPPRPVSRRRLPGASIASTAAADRMRGRLPGDRDAGRLAAMRGLSGNRVQVPSHALDAQIASRTGSTGRACSRSTARAASTSGRSCCASGSRRSSPQHPWPLIRGLIHSDGCRAINRVIVRGKRYCLPAVLLQQRIARHPADHGRTRWTGSASRGDTTGRTASPLPAGVRGPDGATRRPEGLTGQTALS